MAADGSFVVEWETYASSSYQLQALRYTASGGLRDSSTPLQVLASQSSYVYGESVAEQSDGSFIVAWDLYSSGYQIWARRFNSSASGATAIEVSSQASYGTPSVAVDSRRRLRRGLAERFVCAECLGPVLQHIKSARSEFVPSRPGRSRLWRIGRLWQSAGGRRAGGLHRGVGQLPVAQHQILTQRLQLNQVADRDDDPVGLHAGRHDLDHHQPGQLHQRR